MKKFKYMALLGFSSLVLTACGGTSEVAVESAADSNSSEEITSEVESKETVSEVGKRSNPLALGDTATQDFSFYGDDMDEFEGNRSITISNTIRGEEAYNYLMEANEFNEPAPEGMEWVMVDVEYKLNSATTEDAPLFAAPDFKVISADGSQVSQDSTYPTLSDGDEFGYVDLYSGGSATGKYAFYAPVGEEVLLEYNDYMNDGIFFSL